MLNITCKDALIPWQFIFNMIYTYDDNHCKRSKCDFDGGLLLKLLVKECFESDNIIICTGVHLNNVCEMDQ